MTVKHDDEEGFIRRVTELEARLAAAEARIAMLEARPPAILPPIFDRQPVYPPPIYQPPGLPYTVTIGDGCQTLDTTAFSRNPS